MPKEDASIDYYAILGVSPSATPDEIRKQFKKLALLYHPDRNVGKEAEFNTKFQSIQAAHELLTDPTRRRVYDRSRAVYRATNVSSNGYSSTYRSSPPTQSTRANQSNGPHSAYFAKAQAAQAAQAAKEHAARAAQARADAETAQRRQPPSSGWAHRRPDNWGYGQGRSRREEVPRTPRKTRDNPYATDEYATRGSNTDEPRKETGGFFANRNPREKEWMHEDRAYSSGGGGGGGSRRFAAEAKASEQPHSAPRPASTSYAFTPRERVRMNLYEGAPRPQRSNDDFSASGRGSPRMRSHPTRESPTQSAAQSNIHNRRKSSNSGIGSELNNSEGSRFTYLFNKDGPRGPARSARHRPPEVEEDEDDDDDDFFTKLKNNRKAKAATEAPFSSKRHSSHGDDHMRGRTAEPIRTSQARPTPWRDTVSPDTLSSSDSERESSVSPTPPKPKVDPGASRPKARMRKARVDDADEVSSESEKEYFSKPSRGKHSKAFGFNFKFDTSSSQETMTNGAETDPPSPAATQVPPIFDFSAYPSHPPDSNGSGSRSEAAFDPQAWKDMFTPAGGNPNFFEPAQSPRKMPANNKMHSSFNSQSPVNVNFSRPRPTSMAPDADDSEIPRFSSPELESESKRPRPQEMGARSPAPPPPPAAAAQPQTHPQHHHPHQHPHQHSDQQQPVPPTTTSFVFQASQWQQTFSNINPFEMHTKKSPSLGSTSSSRPTSRNRKAGGANKKIPVSAFPVPPKPTPETSAKSESEKSSSGNLFSAFTFPKTPSMQNSKSGNGTSSSTPSDTGLAGGGMSGVSGVPSPMAMDLDTPNTSPPPKEQTAPGSESATGAATEKTSAAPQTNGQQPTSSPMPGNPFEPDRSSRRTRSRSPKKAHKATSSTSVKSNTALPRDASPPLEKPETTASNTNTMPRPTKASSPKKARTRLSMDDLGAVPPFAAAPSASGINGQWTEFADSLPFASQPASHLNLSPPASPKRETREVPPAPLLPGAFTEFTDAAYTKYSNQMQNYQTHWNQWNEDINGHFKARLELEVMACAKNQGLTGGAFLGGLDGVASDLKSIDQALKDFEDDRQIREAWVAACQRHGVCLAAWKVYLQTLESKAS